MIDVLTIGDVKMDTFVMLHDANVHCGLQREACQICLSYGTKIAVERMESQLAGSAANVAVGLARCGLKTAIVSYMGEDETYALAMKQLKTERVNGSFIKKTKRAKSAQSIVLTFQGERTILTSFIDTPYRLPNLIKAPKWIYVSEMGPASSLLFRDLIRYKQKHPSVCLAMNPGSEQIREREETFLELLKQTNLLFLNVEEAQALTKTETREISDLVRAILDLGVQTVILTDGQQGAYYGNKTLLLSIPIFPGQRVESTGAGDSFAAGFLAAVLANHSPDIALA